MRRILGVFFLAVIFALGAGCAATLPTNSYTPQNFVRASGKVDIGQFFYIPFQQEIVKKPNQIQTTAIGSLYISTNIADFVKRATALELEKSGITLDASSPIQLNGNILELKDDDLGYSTTWTYKIQYIIKDQSSGSILFDKTFATEPKKAGKFGLALDYSNMIGDLILDGYDLFIRDPEVQKIFAESGLQSIPPKLDKNVK